MEKQEKKYIAYLDTGGTFTDCVVVGSDGSFVGGKALTKNKELVSSFLGSIENAAEKLNLSLKEFLPQCEIIGYGTTLGTNIVVTQQGGPKLGFITTRGFEDRTIIMRQRAAGLSTLKGCI